MKTVRPKPLAPPLNTLPLTPEEGFVLSRIDGRLSVRDLVALTGIEEQRVEQIVDKLATHGAIAVERDVPNAPESGTTSLADFAAVLGLDPTAFGGSRAAVEKPVSQSRVERSSDVPPAAPEPVQGGAVKASAYESRIDAMMARLEADEATDTGAGETDGAEQGAELIEVEGEGEGAEATNDAVDDESPEAAANERNYRQIYETRFHALPVDGRVHAAQTLSGADLFALCLDADPRVIAVILDNTSSGLDHARLIAQHHRTTVGLELMSRRVQFLRDSLVERRLLRNPQCGDTVLGRIMATKNCLQTYKVAIDREVPELTRVKSRGHLRKRFQTSPSEDRADLVTRTEGRCLTFLTGCAFDAKMTSILCGKTYNSVIFIQNLAKFSATPPSLLAHLIKQPFVRKIVPLKRLLLQHPNMPGEVKRQF